jgi:1-acyl-sn-glycerol-3-phosphate acyltransferase
MTASLAARLVRLACGASVRTVGYQPCQRPCVYFSNHTSHLDALVIWAALPPGIRKRTRPVAAGDYWRGGPIRRWLAGRVFNAVLVERFRVTVRNNPVNQFQEVVDAGNSLILFPEGTRSATGKIGLFKGGLYHLAVRRPELDLVPVHIDNLNRILPRGEFFPVPLLSCVTLGHAMHLKPGESKQDFLERARRAVIELKSE